MYIENTQRHQQEELEGRARLAIIEIGLVNPAQQALDGGGLYNKIKRGVGHNLDIHLAPPEDESETDSNLTDYVTTPSCDSQEE